MLIFWSLPIDHEGWYWGRELLKGAITFLEGIRDKS
jgi:hypothetical protein